MAFSAATAEAAHQNTTVCPECAAPLQGSYCHVCGSRPVDHHEYTLKHFFSHLLHEVTHFDSKILVTLRVMVTKPGQLVVDYLAGRRKRYVPPMRLFLIVFALHLFLYTAFKTTALYDVSFLSANEKTGSFERILDKIAAKRHVTKDVVEEQLNARWHTGANWLQFGDVFVFGGCVALLFYTRQRYFVEHLIFSLNMNTFMLGISILSWPYYLARGGLVARGPAMLVAAVAITTYLFVAAQRVYGGSTGPMLVRTVLMFLAIEASRVFFIMLTFFIAFFSLIPR